MRKAITAIFLIVLTYGIYLYRDDINNFIIDNYLFKKEIIILDANEYKSNNVFLYVKETENFFIENKQDFLNSFYTILNNGWNEFSFYCSDEYVTCENDIKEISYNKTTLSNINNFIHPFNNYKQLYITIDSNRKITILIDKLYSESEISTVNNRVNTIYNDLIKETMSDREKIRTIHDYIINNTTYDTLRADLIKEYNAVTVGEYQSHKATGPLFEGVALCGGYTDLMALFLHKMGIKNYKIASENHVWNLVYLDNSWYHLDLTWDDPVMQNNQNTLIHRFFLITTEQLENEDTEQHTYDKEIFIEAN